MGGGQYPLFFLTDRKHLSFVSLDRTRQKITIEKVVLAGRVASEISLSEEEASSSGSLLGSAGSSSESENKTETERIVSVTYLIRLNRI